MLLIGLRLRVATGTGENAEVIRIGMTVVTGFCLAVVLREPGVIELGSQPAAGVVTRLASGRESGRDMVRIVRVLVIRLVTRVAVGRQILVVVVYVAVAALHLRMRTSQRKWRLVVIEIGRDPCRRGVA